MVVTQSSNNEIIVVVSADVSRGNTLLNDLGISKDGILKIVTKYYSANVEAKAIGDLHAVKDCCDTVKAIVVFDDAIDVLDSPLLESFSEDCVRIVLSDNTQLLDACIDKQFELVPITVDSDIHEETDCGITRIREALKCRIWSTLPGESSSSVVDDDAECSKTLDTFDSLITRVRDIHLAATSQNQTDQERRDRAAAVASELASLLCGDSGSDVSDD